MKVMCHDIKLVLTVRLECKKQQLLLVQQRKNASYFIFQNYNYHTANWSVILI